MYYTYIQIFVCVIYICIYICTYVCLRCVCVCVEICTYMYIYMYLQYVNVCVKLRYAVMYISQVLAVSVSDIWCILDEGATCLVRGSCAKFEGISRRGASVRDYWNSGERVCVRACVCTLTRTD